ncbi:MAG: hypothetical protein RIE08_05465 [Acidimicrobiales bacterium]
MSDDAMTPDAAAPADAVTPDAAAGGAVTRRRRPLAWIAAAAVAGAAAVLSAVLVAEPDVTLVPARVVSADVEVTVPESVAAMGVPAVRTTEPYEGLGTWLDVFDFSPPYGPGGEAALDPIVLDEMAAQGVRTVFIQAARLEERSPDVLEDRWVLAEMLMRADAADIDLVGWYLPFWGDDGEDLAHLKAIADFTFMGLRFDGIAVDIEWNADGLEPAERSDRLVRLSQQLRDHVGPDTALGAITMPPVLLEVINEDFWPEFPWARLEPLYDVWMPMSYWSFRSDESGYGDGYAYNEESTRRLRNNLGDPEALVHGIGGIGGVADNAATLSGPEPLAEVEDLVLFAQSLVDTASIGGSIYDWRTLDPLARETLDTLFSDGIAAGLGAG